jgi:hypothetical protein
MSTVIIQFCSGTVQVGLDDTARADSIQNTNIQEQRAHEHGGWSQRRAPSEQAESDAPAAVTHYC